MGQQEVLKVLIFETEPLTATQIYSKLIEQKVYLRKGMVFRALKRLQHFGEVSCKEIKPKNSRRLNVFWMEPEQKKGYKIEFKIKEE